MTGLLALQYPLAYASVFEPLTDFEVWDEAQETHGQTTTKEVWLDYSAGRLEDYEFGSDGIILPTYDDPDRNVLCVARVELRKPKIAIWRGEKRHLKLLEQCCDIVALPWYEYGRMSYVNEGESHKYHLYGFCNLDELRRYPVRSLSTSVPITAAVLGIDLTTRERRPKNLPQFSYEMKLNDKQIELAVKNVMAVKEALQSHVR